MKLLDNFKKTVGELLDLEGSGQSLPPDLTASKVAEIETNGDVVDLTTGDIMPGEADARYMTITINGVQIDARVIM